MKPLLLVLFSTLVVTGCAESQQSASNFAFSSTREVKTGLRVPWEILWGPDGWIWLTERGSSDDQGDPINPRISRVHPETGEQKILATLDNVFVEGEAGLLGMALDPDFAQSPYVYYVYTYFKDDAPFERLVRRKYLSDSLGAEEILLDGIVGSGIHIGSRLAFGADGTLLMTTGEAGDGNLSQEAGLNGKVLRLQRDGSIPADNPNPQSYIWTKGHRNPQGLVFGRNNTLYASEHGTGNDDEVNIISKGRNYGWPAVAGYCNEDGEITFCRDSSVVEPIAAWTPTIAPCGMDFYDSERFPDWKNSLLLTTLNGATLFQLKLDDAGGTIVSEKRYAAGTFGRLRDVCISPDGRVFLATSNHDGRGRVRSGDDKIIEVE